MIVPAAIMPKAEDIRDPADIPKPDPQPHDDQNPLPLREGELIICKDDPSSTEWYVAEVWKVLPDKVEVKYLSTRTPALEDYPNTTVDQVRARLKQAHFRRTWFFSGGKNAGKGTSKPPFPNNPNLRVWSGPLPNRELPAVLLVRAIAINGFGVMSKKTLELVSNLSLPHAATPLIEDAVPAPDCNNESYYTVSGSEIFDTTRKAL